MPSAIKLLKIFILAISILLAFAYGRTFYDKPDENFFVDSPAQKQALIQSAAALTASMTTDLADSSAIDNTLRLVANSAACLASQYDTSSVSTKRDKIEKLVVNTSKRRRAYNDFNNAASGHVFKLPTDSGCLKP